MCGPTSSIVKDGIHTSTSSSGIAGPGSEGEVIQVKSATSTNDSTGNGSIANGNADILNTYLEVS